LGVQVMGAAHKLPTGVRIKAAIVDRPLQFPGIEAVHIVDFSWTTGDGKPPPAFAQYEAAPDDTCRIVLTSGTTGDPKAVAFSHRMVGERLLRHQYAFGSDFPAYARTFLELTFATSLGYMMLFHTLTRGGTLFFFGGSFEHAVDAIESYRVQSWIGSPSGLLKYLAVYEKDDLRRCRLDMILCAGSQLPRQVSERACARLCANFYNIYGSTEASMVATAPARAIAATPGAVGYILPGIVVQAVDGRGQPAAPGADGAIRIRGPYNAKEYMGDPEESRKVFRDGWFYPGDIGSIGPEGLLIISGREKSVLSVGGHKVTPELIEDLLLSFDGVEQAGVFPVVNSVGLEEVHAAIVARAEVDERQLFLHCQQGLPDHLVPRRFIKVEALPRNDMGKINRARLPDVAR